MAPSAAAVGHRACAIVRLHEEDRQRLIEGVFRPGGQSVMFRFPLAAEHEGGDLFGAIIELVDNGSDGWLRVQLWFWQEIAAIYVTPGSEFEVWYGHTVGDGVVLPDSAGAAERGADARVGE